VLARTAIKGEAAVRLAVEALQIALVRRGLDEQEVAGAARALGSEWARWSATGRGAVVRRFRWIRKLPGGKRPGR
jgi:hypothetical protein